MPVLQLMYSDGTTELLPLPVEIWANNEPVVTKVIASPAPFNKSALIPRDWQMRIGQRCVPREINTGLVTITVPYDEATQCRPIAMNVGDGTAWLVLDPLRALFEGWVPEEGATG